MCGVVGSRCVRSIVDKHRNVVSWTTTIEENMGSGVVVPNRGFLLNTELTGASRCVSVCVCVCPHAPSTLRPAVPLNVSCADFDPLPTYPGTTVKAANRPQGGKMARRTAVGADASTMGGKRPRSSMNPLIVIDHLGRPYVCGGVAECVCATSDPYLRAGPTQSARPAAPPSYPRHWACC